MSDATQARVAVASFAVELRDVGKRFGPVVALDGVDLAIRKGEFFSLLGPSGCGKTTTLNLIGGFETASRGTLLIDGQPMGGGMCFVRDLCHILDALVCYLGFLWPLWDARRQCLFADKIMNTVVLSEG